MSEPKEEKLSGKIFEIGLGLVFFIIAIDLEKLLNCKILSYVFYLISYIVLGHDVVIEAVEGIFEKNPFDENFLMFVATVGAAILGNFSEAVSVMLFYMIGETAEDFAVDSSTDKIEKLLSIEPEWARLVEEGVCKVADPHDVKAGQIIRVFAGEKVPLDGKISYGSCLLDTKTITGESNPVFVEKGSTVKSGSIVTDRPVDILVTECYDNSTIAKIVKLTRQAKEKKAATEKFITAFARVYTPVVILFAVLLAVVPSLITSNWTVWVHRALTFLIISCPCALVLSVPLAFFGGIAACASEGILVKGSEYLQNLSNVKAFAFDKTGTITEGCFKVSKAENAEGYDIKTLLTTAYALESKSSHPLAKSFCDYCSKNNVVSLNVSNVVEVPGKGLCGALDGKKILCGNAELLKNEGLVFEEKDGFETCIYVSCDKNYVGRILFTDRLKENVVESVDLLKKNGVCKTVLLSGDKDNIAKDVAESAGIDEAYGNLLPQDKVLQINKLKEFGITAFVGDGINDAPVIATADIGISMGTEGSAAAIEASGIVIVKDDIAKIPVAIKCSSKTMKIARENIIFALVVKLACLVLGALGFASLLLAVFADTGVALICILNSLRALKV